MVSWAQPKSVKQLKRIIRAARNVTPSEESGQPCPRCGDMWPWTLVRCRSCGARLR